MSEVEQAMFLYDEDIDEEVEDDYEAVVEESDEIRPESFVELDPLNYRVKTTNSFSDSVSRKENIVDQNETSAAHKSGYSAKAKNTSSDPLATLLKSWNLYECYDILKSKNITVESLKYIQPRHMDQIFGHNMGLLIIFEHKVKLWQENKNSSPPTEPLYTPPPVRPTPSITPFLTPTLTSAPMSHFMDPNPNFKNVLPISVRTMLEECEETYGFLKTYEKQKFFKPEQRREIVRFIIQKFIDSNTSISTKMFRQLAKEIIEIFPTENIETYYIEDPETRKSKGKLYDRYYQQKRKLRISNPDSPISFGKPKKIPKLSYDSSKNPELENLRVQLQKTRKWDIVFDKWQTTFPLRREEINTKPLDETFQRWPLYKYKFGPPLVDYDFKTLNNTQFNYEIWDKLCNVLPTIFEERLKDPNAKALFSELKWNSQNMSIDNIHLYYLKLLHAILTPSALVLDGKRVKHSIAEGQQAFTVEVPKMSDIDQTMATDHASIDASLPIVFAIGKQFHYEKFVVVFDNFKLAFDTYLSAVDFCIKFTSIFNLKYPYKSANVWLFIQVYCYNLPAKTKNPKIQTFITDVKSFVKNEEP